jgi:hypothetical protein
VPSRPTLLAALRERLRQAGLLIPRSPGPNPVPDGETELCRWLAAYPRATVADGFRAGWTRMAHWVRPRLVETDAAWWRQVSVNEQLHAQRSIPVPPEPDRPRALADTARVPGERLGIPLMRTEGRARRVSVWAVQRRSRAGIRAPPRPALSGRRLSAERRTDWPLTTEGGVKG